MLGNQIEETVALVRLAEKSGAFAASAFGAGFGGAVWAAAPADTAGAVLERWRSAYATRFPARAAGIWSGLMSPSAGMRDSREIPAPSESQHRPDQLA